MEIILKSHTKVKLGELKTGETFRLINLMKVYQVVDLTKVIPAGAQNQNTPVINSILVYCVDLSTGEVHDLTKETEVYLCPMRSVEVDEEN